MNYIDTRDLYKRQCELQSLKDALKEAQDELEEFDPERPNVAPDDGVWHEEKERLEDAVESARSDFGEDEQEELEELDNLENEVGSEWRHGETMIPAHQFRDYAEELAADSCDMEQADIWPFRHIDWGAAAEELKQEYSEVEYQGTTYLFHAS